MRVPFDLSLFIDGNNEKKKKRQLNSTMKKSFGLSCFHIEVSIVGDTFGENHRHEPSARKTEQYNRISEL